MSDPTTPAPADEHGVDLDLDAIAPPDPKEPFRFRFAGQVFTTLDPFDTDIVAMRGAVDSDPGENLAMILGEVEWDRLEALEETFTLRHADLLVEGYFKHHGIHPGKQPGSQKSSRPRRIR